MNLNRFSRQSEYLRYFGLILVLLSVSQAFGQAVNTFHGDRFTHYRPDDWVSLAPALNITSIDISEDHILFGTTDGGILRYDKYANHWDLPYTISTGLRSNTIYEIVYNELDGALYARTPRGIDVLYFSDGFWKESTKRTMPQKRLPDVSAVASIRKQKDFRFPRFYRPPNSYLPDFFSDISLNFLLPNKVFDRQNREFTVGDRVTDQWQRLWFATDGLGVLKADLFTYSIEQQMFSISNISPRDVFFAGDDIWIAGLSKTDGTRRIEGITKTDFRMDSWQYYEAPFINGLFSHNVSAIDGNEQYVSFATNVGVAVYQPAKDRWRSADGRHGLEADEVLDVLVQNKTLYAATESGLNIIQLPEMNVSSVNYKPLNNRRIYRLAKDSDSIWLASVGGVFQYFPKTQSFSRLEAKVPFPDNYITAIYVDQSELWIASDYGIARLDRKNKTWKSYIELNRKFHINDILKYDDFLWFATDSGLLKYDPEENFWRLFTVRDGLMSAPVYRIDAQEDYLWLSTDAGVTMFRYYRANRID